MNHVEIRDVRLAECVLNPPTEFDTTTTFERPRKQRITVDADVPDDRGDDVDVLCRYEREESDSLGYWKVAYVVGLRGVSAEASVDDIALIAIELHIPTSGTLSFTLVPRCAMTRS